MCGKTSWALIFDALFASSSWWATTSAWAVWAVRPTTLNSKVILKFSWNYFFCIWQRINPTFIKRWGAGALPHLNDAASGKQGITLQKKLQRFHGEIMQVWNNHLGMISAIVGFCCISLVFQGNRLTWAVCTLFLRCLQHHMRIVFHSNWNELRLHKDSGQFFFSKQTQGVTHFSGCKMLNAGKIEDCSMKHF